MTDKAKFKRCPTKTPAAAGRARIVEESYKAVKRAYDLPEGPMPKPNSGERFDRALEVLGRLRPSPPKAQN